jgi:putative transposase
MKFQNKYRIPSARASWWDYRWAGAYFITICTQNRTHCFGEIVNQQMQLSHTGVLADILWYQLPYHAKNVELGAFVVMPNHIHGILILKNDNTQKNHSIGPIVETLHATSLPLETLKSLETSETSKMSRTTESCENPTDKNEKMSEISPKSNSISTIIRSYKSAVTKNAHRLGIEFQWQARFHDHIIRNDAEYQRINDYIENNPLNWDKDKFFKKE